MTGHLSEADLARMARGGLAALSAEQGLALLDAGAGPRRGAAGPGPAGPGRAARPAARRGRCRRCWRGLVRGPARRAGRGRGGRTGGRAAAAAGRAARGRRRTGCCWTWSGRTRPPVLGHASPDAVEPGRAFRELGFDSLTAVELRNRLNAATGLRLPATWSSTTRPRRVLAGYLRAELLGDRPPAAAAPAPAAAAAAGEPVAIVGMGCRFPGGVADPEDLWELLAAGADAISGFPADRGWDLDGLYDPDPDHAGHVVRAPGRVRGRRGGVRRGVLRDQPAGGAGDGPAAAAAAGGVLGGAGAGRDRPGVAARAAGPGCSPGRRITDYGAAGRGAAELEGYLLTGSAASVVSGRVAYTLGLEGPAVTVDTACSSSLVALHLACQALRAGECDLALAGGVTVMATPGAFVGFSRQRGLAADGRCKAFAAAADGIGLGRGRGDAGAGAAVGRAAERAPGAGGGARAAR